MKKMRFLLLLAAAWMGTLTMNAQDDNSIGFSIGYINKDWVSNFSGGAYHENLWGEEGKKLHGIEMGFSYQPTHAATGIGLWTGAYADVCFSESKAMDYDTFTETSLYIPAHISFRIPVGYDADIKLHGGIGINWVLAGEFKDYHRFWSYYNDYPDAYLHYGRDGFPHSFNFQAEAGIAVRINRIQINGGYSWGLSDHEFYPKDNVKTHQNKLFVTIGYVL
ncbi:MAG: hypothetical protein MJZ69_01355 [Bacteroidaceae bacterium]|nr:hypothetical protein [Candidatus Minthousia equi]MCQ2245415.1 hypothetical protein [Bacteroidaceae bacterium]